MNKAVLFGLVLFGLFLTASCAKNWAGSNLYYAAGLYQNEQTYLFTNLRRAGVKVLRVWLDGQPSSVKGTNIRAFPALEPHQIGQYDDTVLNLYDDLMVVARSYGIKLLISMHSFNSLQAGDVYKQRFGEQGFYTNSQATQAFDNRLRHVLSHVNPKVGKPWSQCNDYIFAFEAENEAMIGLGQPFIQQHQGWQCDRAKTIRAALGNNHGILITTGGESWVDESFQPDFFSCPALDVIACHGYGVGDFNTGKLKSYVQKAQSAGKKLLFEEWGSCYYNTPNNNCPSGGVLNSGTRDYNIKTWANQIAASGIPWMYWQILPNKDPHYGEDYEIGIDDVNWQAFVTAAQAASSFDSPFDFGPWLIN